MKKSFFIHSVPRSGHHAIINWMINQEEINFIHLNNCKPVDDQAVACWQYSDNNTGKPIGINGIVSNELEVGLVSNNAVISNFNKDTYDYLFASTEDSNINDFSYEKFFHAENVQKIIVLRDIYNWLASLIKHFESAINNQPDWLLVTCKSYIRIWEKLIQNINDPDVLFISYNKWFVSKEYRRDICDKLKFRFTDNMVDFIPTYGSGSSFTSLDLQNQARKMDVLNRWKQMIDCPIYRKIVAETKNETKQINKEIFDL